MKMRIYCNIFNEKFSYFIENKESLVEKLFSSSDVTFLVGTTEIQELTAHRCVLIASSEKFEAMLRLHDPDKPIVISEMEPGVFLQLLKAIYLNYFDVDSVVMAQDCAQMFNEFGLISAVEALDNFFSNLENINSDTVILLYEVNRSSKTNPNVVQQCVKFFETKTYEVLESTSFSQANPDTVLTIFERPALNIYSEINLVDALYEYAKKNNALPSDNPTENDDRFAVWIKPALSKIRLLTLTPKEFLNSFSVQNLLSKGQVFSVLANINVPENPLYKMPDGLSTCKTSRLIQKVLECQRILEDIIDRAQPVGKKQKVRKLIQDLVDEKIVPEQFCHDIQSQLNRSLRESTDEFLKRNLPGLRQSLTTKEIVIEGIKPPSHLFLFVTVTGPKETKE